MSPRVMCQALFHSAVVLLLMTGSTGCMKSRQPFPKTDQRPVTDMYFGVRISEDYRWLDNADDPAVRNWIDAQNAFSNEYFNGLPSRVSVQKRLTELYGRQTVQYSSLLFSKKLFGLKSEPPKNQPFIVVFDSADDIGSERIVVDPNALNAKGTTAIDWFVPSRDGRLLAVSLSENGSENGSVHVFEVNNGKELPDTVPRVQYPTGGGSLQWNKEGTGFYYTRYPHENERPSEDLHLYQQIYFHKLGTASSADAYIVGKEFPRIAETVLTSSFDGRYLLATVANGDGGEVEHFLRRPDGNWVQLTRFTDKVSLIVFGENDLLYLLSHKDAPLGKILTVSLSNPELTSARTIVPQGNAVITNILAGKTNMYLEELIGGPSQIRVCDLFGKPKGLVPIQPVSSVDELLVLDNDMLLFCNETYLAPQGWYRYDPVTATVTRATFSPPVVTDMSDVEVLRDLATSRDGTKIPMNIIRKKGTRLNGENPTILYGYGGFGISEVPQYKVYRWVWLEQGGVFVIANLRGGGEYGEEWHDQGKLTKKQNVFDDFVASAQHLIELRYTNRSKLAIMGGSNGGLLMGTVLTQHPELFKAVVSIAGIYDMLRVELFPNGSFNVTEYGTTKNAEQFRALYAYSPYHHVEDGKAYPAVLFQTGDNDGRVDPANSRKMTARLQAATSPGQPILLSTNPSTGHGFGTGLSTRIAQEADRLAFLFDQLGVQHRMPTR